VASVADGVDRCAGALLADADAALADAHGGRLAQLTAVRGFGIRLAQGAASAMSREI
jgi:hypothetical protein